MIIMCAVHSREYALLVFFYLKFQVFDRVFMVLNIGPSLSISSYLATMGCPKES